MRANAQPIGDNPVLMICADICVEGAFGDRDMVLVALDCGIGFESADWQISLGYALDWQIGIGIGLLLHWKWLENDAVLRVVGSVEY